MTSSETKALQPSDLFDQDTARRALDDLFTSARHYSAGKDYLELMRFIGQFRAYSPFNALLVYIQKPGARFVAPAGRWFQRYGRRVKPGARPLVILKPMGPVMFVFDVGDTEAEEDAPPLPREVVDPFAVSKGYVGHELGQTIENAVRDGVRVNEQDAAPASAGSIQKAAPGQHLYFKVREKPEPVWEKVPVKYDLLLNRNQRREEQYVTLVHELAHLYCGHLGTPDPHWWPDRLGVDKEVAEYEAESVCCLACLRLGIVNPSHEYLAGYLCEDGSTPPISLECVVKVAGLIEQMGRERLGPRKKGTS